MHRQDCIWRSKYGCFLQPLQVLLGWKRINGDPVKSRMQEHELFLYIVEKSLRRLRFQRFIDHSEATLLSRKQDESAKDHLLRLDENFATFCKEAEMSNDEPTRLCALFLKEIESYLRCIHGVRNQDFWLLEIEGRDWLGAYKICGKNNYVTETLHRMDTLYGDKMSDHDLGWLRMIIFLY